MPAKTRPWKERAKEAAAAYGGYGRLVKELGKSKSSISRAITRNGRGLGKEETVRLCAKIGIELPPDERFQDPILRLTWAYYRLLEHSAKAAEDFILIAEEHASAQVQAGAEAQRRLRERLRSRPRRPRAGSES